MTNTELQKKEPRAAAPGAEATRAVTFTPRVDIVETENELLLFADLPGVKPADVDVRFENGELTVHGRAAPRHAGGDYLFYEYGVGDFHRAFAITPDVDASRISAELKQGVLTVHLPKSEAVKPRKIAVSGE